MISEGGSLRKLTYFIATEIKYKFSTATASREYTFSLIWTAASVLNVAVPDSVLHPAEHGDARKTMNSEIALMAWNMPV